MGKRKGDPSFGIRGRDHRSKTGFQAGHQESIPTKKIFSESQKSVGLVLLAFFFKCQSEKFWMPVYFEASG